MKMDFKTQK